MGGLWLKIFRRRRMRDEIEAEIAFHKEMAAAQGNAIPFGNTTVMKEQALDMWRFNFFENLWRDLVYAARGLRRSPALVFSALLSLTLGIGANTAIFSLGVEFLFSHPSVSDPASVVAIRIGGNSHSKHEVVEFVRASGVFQDVVGINDEAYINWNDGSETRRVFGMATTKNYFTTLGVPIAHGRGILPSDPNEVAVLCHEFWRKNFNADPSIVGRAINLDGRAYTVVGIMPARSRTLIGFGFSPDLYVPRFLDDTALAMYARLKPGMTIGEARAGVTTVAKRLDETMPERWKYARNIEVTPVAGDLSRLRQEEKLLPVGLFFAILLAVVGLVLLIACVNVASLLLARASARRRETAVRLALGASKGRLLQQMLVESLLLSMLGAGLGLATSQAIAMMLARFQPPIPVPIRLQMELDWRVGLYAAFLAVFATVACGLLPALQTAKESIVSDFHREGKVRLRRALVVAQIAISVVVLSTGFLFLRNLTQSNAISPGFDVRRTLRAEVHLPPNTYKEARRNALYVDQALRALEAIPGAEAVAAARLLPFTDMTTFGAELTFPDTGEKVRARWHYNAVTPAYFRAMDIPVLLGTTFPESATGERTVVVNRTFVERYLGKRPPVGTVFLWGREGKMPYRIVGVAGATKNMTIGENDEPQLYESLTQIGSTRPKVQFVMRSATPPITQLEPVRRALRRVEPMAGLEVQTLYSSIGLAFLPSQVGAVLLGSMGVLGLLLAAIGLYGVMVFMVARRTREIGVRMAIGASRGDITGMVLWDAGKLLVLGSAIGLFIAAFVMKPLAMFLVAGLTPGDPVTFLAVGVVLVLIGVVASWGPVRRALAIDPMTSLRYE